MTGTEGNSKNKKIQQDLLSTLGPEATYLITQSEYRTQPDKIELDNLFKSYDRNYSPKRNKNHSRAGFLGKINRYGNTGRAMGELNRIIERTFQDFGTELIISQFITSTLDRRLRDQLLKGKDLDVPKQVEQLHQNTYDRKNKQKTKSDALTSSREKKSRKNLYTN